MKMVTGKTIFREQLYVLNYLGALLVVLGLLLLLPLIPYWLYDDRLLHHIEATVFIYPALVCLLPGLVIQKKISFRVPSIKGAMFITSLGWLLCGVAGAIPFMLALDKSFIDAFFESVSGFTTTGITVFIGLDTMPRSILFWRSLTQWLGGLGILTFFLAVSFRGGSAAAALFSAEGHKISTSRPVPGISHTLKILWAIYSFFTVISFILFLIGGMDVFDALNHSFTCISTGGFSTHDASLAFYTDHAYPRAVFIEYAVILIMLAGGTNFLVHYKVFTGNVFSICTDFEMKWYWGILAGAVVLICFDHFQRLNLSFMEIVTGFHEVFRAALFQVASMLTSTGYLTVDINTSFFHAVSKQIFMMIMVVGGCVGSTAGGIKVLRFAILAKTFQTQIKRIWRPGRAVLPVVTAGKIIPDRELERIASLFWIWLILIGAGAVITAVFSDLDAWQSFSGMASAMGNMGPFYFSVDKMASLHWLIKLTYIFGMLAGRLEVIPLAFLFSRVPWR
jgi:trk system potassium uptake protein TrkH